MIITMFYVLFQLL